MAYWTGTEWAAEPSAAPKRPSRARHILEALTEGTLVALLVVGLVAGTSLAGSKSSSSVWIEGSASARGAGLAFGDAFRVGYATSTRQPWAHAQCYPVASTVYRETYGDGWIWGQYFSVYGGGPQPQAFQLVDPVAENWTDGGARCTLELVKFNADGRMTVLATQPFSVAP